MLYLYIIIIIQIVGSGPMSEIFRVDRFDRFNMFLFRFYITNYTLNSGDKSGFGYVINALDPTISMYLDHNDEDMNAPRKTDAQTNDAQSQSIDSSVVDKTETQRRLLSVGTTTNQNHPNTEMIIGHTWNTFVLNSDAFVVNSIEKQLIVEIAIVDSETDNKECNRLNVGDKDSIIWSKNYKERNEFCPEARVCFFVFFFSSQKHFDNNIE